MQGQDIAVLLKLVLAGGGPHLSKDLASELCISPSEISKSLQRSRDVGLVYLNGAERRVNRLALLEFILHGMKYVFPPQKGGMTRGIATGAAVEPLNELLSAGTEPPMVWPCVEGKVRGLSFSPLYRGAPQAALRDKELYKALVLCDAIRDGRARERNLGGELLKSALGL